MEELCILCEVWQGRPFVCELPCTDTTGPMLTNSHSLTVTLQIWKACGPSTGTDILLGTVPLTLTGAWRAVKTTETGICSTLPPQGSGITKWTLHSVSQTPAGKDWKWDSQSSALFCAPRISLKF